MAVALRSVGVSAGANTNSLAITKPVDLTVGDLMIAQIVTKSGVTVTGPPTGFTSIRSDADTDENAVSTLYWKIAVAADAVASIFNFDLSVSSSNRGAISAWTGHNPIAPIGANNGQGNAASATVTAPTITPLANSMILMICGIANDDTNYGYAITTSDPGGWNEAYDISTTQGSDCALAMGNVLRAQATATGNGTATCSASDTNVGQLVSISPLVLSNPFFNYYPHILAH